MIVLIDFCVGVYVLFFIDVNGCEFLVVYEIE